MARLMVLVSHFIEGYPQIAIGISANKGWSQDAEVIHWLLRL